MSRQKQTDRRRVTYYVSAGLDEELTVYCAMLGLIKSQEVEKAIRRQVRKLRRDMLKQTLLVNLPEFGVVSVREDASGLSTIPPLPCLQEVQAHEG